MQHSMAKVGRIEGTKPQGLSLRNESMNAKRIFFALPIAVLAVGSVAMLSSSKFDAFKSGLSKAEGVEATVQVNIQGGGASTYSLMLKKPNMLRLETESELVIADGKEVTTFMKAKNQYYTAPQTEQSLTEILNPMELQVWAPFFNKDAFKGVARVEDAGSRRIKGENHSVVNVEADPKGDTKMSFFISDDTKMPSRVAITAKGLTETTEMILATSELSMTAVGSDMFAFAAPAGAKKVDLAAMSAGKWYYDLSEAMDVAKAGNKLIMVDFMADWCGPCKMMDAQVFKTDDFKKATANMVLVKIDVDRQQAVAQRYGVEAMPTVKFLSPSGEIVHEFVGYGGFGQVMGEVEKAKSKFSN